MRISMLSRALPLLLLGGCGGGGGGGGGDDSVPEPNFSIAFSAANFTGHAIDNPYFPLVPGTLFVYEGTTTEGFEHIEFDVTSNTRTIAGVVCVEVHDVARVDGSVVEDTLDWFAQDVDGNVWYFGEDTKQIENGVIVGTEGSWEAGVGGAQPGIVMLASPVVGRVYQQELLAGVAEDRARVSALGVTETVPFGGARSGCLDTEEFTPLEPDVSEHKVYAPGVGLILEIDDDDNRIELVDVQ